MKTILNKIIIFLALSVLTFMNVSFLQSIFTILIVFALSGFIEYFENNKFNIVICVSYTVLSCFFPQFIFMFPIIFYDFLISKYSFMPILSLIPIIIHIDNFEIKLVFILMVITFIGIILKYQSVKEDNLIKKYISQRDDFTEVSIQLNKTIRELRNRQDIEVNVATLNERNRIAREIHDNVGHLLTSSIIQIGAIIATTKEKHIKENLNTVKETLDEGMNSIRNSIHNLHDDSIDLQAQLDLIIENFTFCNISLTYNLQTNIQTSIKYAIISIIKEALANVIKHSNATSVLINLSEHPKIIQLIITDNGTKKSKTVHYGIGLDSIRQRVSTLKGIANFDDSKGFKIFISFPKYLEEDA